MVAAEDLTLAPGTRHAVATGFAIAKIATKLSLGYTLEAALETRGGGGGGGTIPPSLSLLLGLVALARGAVRRNRPGSGQ